MYSGDSSRSGGNTGGNADDAATALARLKSAPGTQRAQPGPLEEVAVIGAGQLVQATLERIRNGGDDGADGDGAGDQARHGLSWPAKASPRHPGAHRHTTCGRF